MKRYRKKNGNTSEASLLNLAALVMIRGADTFVCVTTTPAWYVVMFIAEIMTWLPIIRTVLIGAWTAELILRTAPHYAGIVILSSIGNMVVTAIPNSNFLHSTLIKPAYLI